MRTDPGPIADPPPADLHAVSLMAFKNGFGFVTETGNAPLTEGWFRIPEAPQASFGLLWLSSAREGCWVDRAVADTTTASKTVEADTFDDLILQNQGARVTLSVMVGGQLATRSGKLGRPIYGSVSPYPLAGGFPVPEAPWAVRSVPSGIDYVVLELADGQTELLPRSAVQQVSFAEPPRRTKAEEQLDRRLRGHLAGPEGATPDSAPIEVTYMRKGISWMPSYGIRLLADGKAAVRLDATLINDAADLTDGTVGFVVGVPSFLLQDMLTPVSVRTAWEGLSPYFGHGGVEGYAPMMAQQMANVAATRSGEAAGWNAAEPNPVEATSQGAEQEDLHVYRIEGVSLPKGSRGLFRVFEATVPYEDIYLLTIEDDPVTAYRETVERISDPDIARALQRPKVWHAVRLTNTTKAPWTTGAAATLRTDLAIGQSLMPYTSPGDTVDVKLTVAPGVVASREEQEAARELNALVVNRTSWHRVTVEGALTLENHGPKEARTIVHRRVNGKFLEVGAEGKAVTIASSAYSVNPLSEASWDVTVPAGGELELPFRYEVFVNY